jgi:transducin (beta)-like 1
LTYHIRPSLSRGHTNDINQVKCNPSSTSLASCSDDGTARTWNLQTGTSVVCGGHTAELVHVQWCPRTDPGKDELMATCAKDATTRIWNSITGECLKVFTDHTESLFALAFCPSGRWLATGGADGDIHVYDMQVSPVQSHRIVGIWKANMVTALPRV